MKRVIQAKKLSSYFMTAVVLAALAVGAEPGHAGLLAKSPNSTPGGYPVWFQDQAGMALQGCLNDPPLPVSFCVLPTEVEQPGFLADQPKEFPGNFPIEHFYFFASTPPIPLTNGGIASVVEFAVEAAFNPEIIANPNQEMFHRLRIIFSPNTAAGPGTYTIVHPWGTTVIPPALQESPFGIGGARGRATIDVNIGSAPGNFDGVLGDNPLFTISNFLTQTTPTPPVGYLGDCITASRVTGGREGFNKVEIYGPTGDRIGESELFVVCGQKSGMHVSPTSASFGFWKTGAPSAPTTFTITNLSGVDIPGRDTEANPPEGLILTPGPGFSIPAETDTCADGVDALAPDNTCTFDVVFTPGADGVASETISISSTGNPPVTIPVTGIGDGTAPRVVLGDGKTNQFTTTATATISGTVADNDGGAGVASVQVSVNGAAAQPATLSGNAWSFTVAELNPNSINTIDVTATDAADADGNRSAVVPATITHDNTLPVVELTAPAAGLTNNRTPALTFATSDVNLASTSVSVDGQIVNKTSGDRLDSLADGSHTISVVAIDAAGNTRSGSSTISVDATPPLISVISPKPINQRLGTTNPVLTFGINDANPNSANTVVRLDGTALVNPISGTTTLGPFTAGSSHILTVEAIDGAGNPSTATLAFTIVPADGRIISLGATPPTIADALFTLRHAVNLITLDGDQFAHADVAPLDTLTGIPAPDGSVDIRDALVLLRRIVGLVTSF